ncbi:MAG: bifunctional phosphopantothenoylcysteine decarboxylase/phosphopantothenate--cysteine ligase CoaBC, partial [Firmicutes bacterium]|nr:bifunctional phosphopantothenoylcysteine decarboxylase/phosphopantothenate--cysteine ligase CoaBC [Bacillota bacterium]
PLTFAALTGQRVITELFAEDDRAPANIESAIEHIAVAQRIDLLLVAPATADVLARMAHGLADDFLTTLYLATRAPVIVAPAMNVNMWEHPATQHNVATLRARGVHVVAPEEGYLACGMSGPGRLAGIEAILEAVRQVLGLKRDLVGETVLVTAGPTYEDLDPVRVLTNRSSGKMGFALAEAALRRGARVLLISGPTHLLPPQNVEFFAVRTTEEMRRAVLEQARDATVVIMAAAVADFRPAAPQPTKIKRSAGRLTVALEPTPDILAELARNRGNRILVGFAAETDRLAEHARAKLEAKGLDLVVANDVTRADAGFDVDTNVVTLFAREAAPVELPRMTKREVADRVLDEVVRLRRLSH